MRLWIFLLAVASFTPCHALNLAQDGKAMATVTLAADATPAEESAARELVRYLEAATTASFLLRLEGDPDRGGPSIHVGPTELASILGPDASALEPEEWIIATSGERLLLYGGRPRGTLYAVYRFLEDQVGVRWWTPRDEFVPRLNKLEIPELNLRNKPAFAYRDIFGISGEPLFHAHSRLNGHFSRLPPELGGCERYGPPRHVHNFYDYVDPDVYFDIRPDFFSERGGMRYAGLSQLCLTNRDLLELVFENLVSYIEKSRGPQEPRRFSFSQNDWGGACACEECAALAEKTGAHSGTLTTFMNELADRVRYRYPDILLDTLAYGHTLKPPHAAKLRENIIIRFSALKERDMSSTVTDAVNRSVLEALEGWLESAEHVVVWDYAVSYGWSGDLPLANLPVLARDYRFYLESGVEGILLQHDFPVTADMRDLKLWALAKLIEDPRREIAELVEEFTTGFYGRAGRHIRRYIALLEQGMTRNDQRIGYDADADAYRHIDARFLRKAHKLFEGAERRAAGDGVLTRRLRHARISLDRATLWLWPEFGAALNMDRDAVAGRYRDSCRSRIEQIYPENERADALGKIDLELSVLRNRRYNLGSSTRGVRQ
jgi:hypothetical protein